MNGTIVVLGEQPYYWEHIRRKLEQETDVQAAADLEAAVELAGLGTAGLVLLVTPAPEQWLRRLRGEPLLAWTPVVVLCERAAGAAAALWRENGAADVLDATLPYADISQRLRAAAKRADELWQVAFLDPLTGVYNRRFLDEWMSGPRTEALPLALAMLDIDYFKSINDRYGHDVGDQVLRKLADSIRRHIRKEDRVVRYGGEEFLLLFPKTAAEAARCALESLARQAQEVAVADDGTALPLTFSAGIAEWKPGQPLQAVLRAADQALYRAKAEGRNRTIVADPEAAGASRILLVGGGDYAPKMPAGLGAVHVTRAVGPEEAANEMAAASFDVCVIDMDGEGADPFEWIRRIKAASADRLSKPRIVALSAKEGTALRYLQLGADDFILKE